MASKVYHLLRGDHLRVRCSSADRRISPDSSGSLTIRDMVSAADHGRDRDQGSPSRDSGPDPAELSSHDLDQSQEAVRRRGPRLFVASGEFAPDRRQWAAGGRIVTVAGREVGSRSPRPFGSGSSQPFADRRLHGLGMQASVTSWSFDSKCL